MSKLKQTPAINIMEKAAKQASRKIIRDFGELENLQASSNSIKNFVSNTNKIAKKAIGDVLMYHYPKYNILFKENINQKIQPDENNFLIDPINGYNNFMHGIPHFSLTISRIEKNNIVEGIIFNPITNDFFWVSKGKGSWLNDKRMKVSNRSNSNECIVGGYEIKEDSTFFLQVQNLIKNNIRIRINESTALDLAFVASGKLDGFWKNSLTIWDICPGNLMIVEAGGQISQSNGNDSTLSSENILATNSHIHAKMLRFLNL